MATQSDHMDIANNTKLHLEIESEIARLADDYAAHRALILTERDLQCQLYNRLTAIPMLAGHFPTEDPGITGSRVHADLSWFDNNKRLSILPDISIVEVEHLRTLASVTRGRLPSKQFAFSGNAIIFETKFLQMGNRDYRQFLRQRDS